MGSCYFLSSFFFTSIKVMSVPKGNVAWCTMFSVEHCYWWGQNHCIMCCQTACGEKPEGERRCCDNPHIMWVMPDLPDGLDKQFLDPGEFHMFGVPEHTALSCAVGLASAQYDSSWSRDMGLVSCPIPHKEAGWSWWLSTELIDFAVSQTSSNVGAPFLLCDYVGVKAAGEKNDGEGVAATGIIYWACS